MRLAPGTSLGPYVIDAPLGAGGMGEVYRARDTRLGRDVAIKVLPEAFAADPDRVRRFEQEAQAVAALNHPHICQIYDVAHLKAEPTSESSPSYLVLEYVEGDAAPRPAGRRRSVASRPADCERARGRAPPRRPPQGSQAGEHSRDGRQRSLVRPGGRQAARLRPREGVAAGGRRDLAPAKGRSRAPRRTCRRSRRRGRSVDARSDVFSFGAVFYEALSGRRAFEGDSSIEVLSAVLRDDPRPLGASPLAGVVRRCLEKDVSRRYQTMARFDRRWRTSGGPHRTVNHRLPSCRSRTSVPTKRTNTSAMASPRKSSTHSPGFPGSKSRLARPHSPFAARSRTSARLRKPWTCGPCSKAAFVAPATVFASPRS